MIFFDVPAKMPPEIRARQWVIQDNPPAHIDREAVPPLARDWMTRQESEILRALHELVRLVAPAARAAKRADEDRARLFKRCEREAATRRHDDALYALRRKQEAERAALFEKHRAERDELVAQQRTQLNAIRALPLRAFPRPQ